ncbi:hypothetical protein BGX27_003264 [Mortierella sp. AM989]|nr:hypothetical protein BGX27_003264 [Mortierella sp. AM989]
MILLDAVGHSTARSFVFISLLLSILTHHITIAAPDPTKSVTLSFLDGAGAVIGQPQNIPHAKCTILQVSQFVATGGFASVSTTDLHSALNLYEDPRCQILAGSSVGRWDNVAPVANMVAIRYEGTADASLPTGVVRLEGFPHEMAVQTKIPPMQWVMDPSKGKLLVGVIGSLLGIGVIIGAYQVYQASLYEIPPKKPKKKATGLNIKKIKKKDAYYRKPVRDDQQSFQRLETQELIISPQQSQSQMVERRVAGTGGSRNSQHSESGISLDWNTKTRSNSGNGSDSVLIDMQETKVARIPLREHQSG